MTIHEYRKIRWINKDPIPGEDGLYHQLIEIKNLYNGRIYICSHTTDNPNDGYMGSGAALGRAYKRFGKAAFLKRVLNYSRNEEELRFYEQVIVDKQFISTAHTYNKIRGGGGRKISSHITNKKTIQKKPSKKESPKIVTNIIQDQPKSINSSELNTKVDPITNIKDSILITVLSLIIRKAKEILWHIYQIASILINL